MIATPISHLLKERKNQEIISKLSDCFECRDHSFESDLPRQKLFHCEIQPIHELKESDFIYLEKVKKNKDDLELISFHMASCFSEPSIRNGKYLPNGIKYKPDQMLGNSLENFIRIKNIFGPAVKIAVENNNYYPTEAYNYITEGKFISDLVNENDILFLFDISHAKIAAHYKKISLETYYSSLPLNKLIQVHISRFGFNDLNELIDAHELPTKDDLIEVKEINNQFNAQYFTVEYYRNIEGLIDLLKQLRELVYE